jgi:energy-coupling factor transport system ATP-binding protein
VSVIGSNGSGKSTLLRVMNGARGAHEGGVLVDGIDPMADEASSLEVARLVGFVRQDPVCQLVSSSVADEVSFGPCNLGLEADDVRERVTTSLEAVGLGSRERSGVEGLSGGEQQRLAVAGVLAMRPSYLLLDEATSQLDSSARTDLRSLVRELVAGGVGVLQVTHLLEDVIGSNRVLVMEAGRIIWEGSPADLLGETSVLDRAQLSGADGSSAPDIMRLALSCACPKADLLDADAILDAVTDDDAIDALARLLVSPQGRPSGREGDLDAKADGRTLSLREACVRVEGSDILSHVTFDVPHGSVLVIGGRSGSGKTTAAMALAGVGELGTGDALLDGRPVRAGQVGLAFQRPADQLFRYTVAEDVAYGPECRGMSPEEVSRAVSHACELVGLEEPLMSRAPLRLSGGERRRVALAGIVAAEPTAYVLDEPTAGLDGAGRTLVHGLVRDLASAGSCVVVVTHDLAEWLPCSDAAVLLSHGKVSWSGPTSELVSDEAPFLAAGLRPPLDVSLRARLSDARDRVGRRRS